MGCLNYEAAHFIALGPASGFDYVRGELISAVDSKEDQVSGVLGRYLVTAVVTA